VEEAAEAAHLREVAVVVLWAAAEAAEAEAEAAEAVHLQAEVVAVP
jgi:hypothetical protein